MSYKRSLSCLLLISAFTARASAQDAEQPQLQLRSVKLSGTGCPAGAFAVTIQDNALQLQLPAMVAEVGPSISPEASRRNCLVAMDLAVPAGWSYALESFQSHGYASLSRGTKAEFARSLYFVGNSLTTRLTSSLMGPLEQDLALQDSMPVSNLLWSTCGLDQTLAVNLQVRLSQTDKKNYPDAAGSIALDSWDLKPYSVAWRRCPAS